MRVGDTLAYPPKPNATQSGKNSCQQLGPSVAFRRRAHGPQHKSTEEKNSDGNNRKTLIVHIAAPKNRQVGTPSSSSFSVAPYLGMNCGTPRAIVHVERVSVLSFLPRASKQARAPQIKSTHSTRQQRLQHLLCHKLDHAESRGASESILSHLRAPRSQRTPPGVPNMDWFRRLVQACAHDRGARDPPPSTTAWGKKNG